MGRYRPLARQGKRPDGVQERGYDLASVSPSHQRILLTDRALLGAGAGVVKAEPAVAVAAMLYAEIMRLSGFATDGADDFCHVIPPLKGT